MRCSACGAELILTNVVPDDTVAARGVEHHTFHLLWMPCLRASGSVHQRWS
jgi:hypothetical protein